MDPDHSLLFPYRISDVEVFDDQLAGLRTEFIRPSFILAHVCRDVRHTTQHVFFSRQVSSLSNV